MSADQAADFLKAWRIVAQYAANEIPGAPEDPGFSVTLFQNLETTEYFFALRGAHLAHGDLADEVGKIVADKLSLEQIMIIYNYRQRLVAAAGSHYPVVTQRLLEDETEALCAAYATSPKDGLVYENTLRRRENIVIDIPTHTVYAIELVTSPQADGLGLC